MHLDAIFLVPELHVILLFRPKFANYRKVSSPPHLLPISHFHCQVFSQTTFLVAETKIVKMWYRGEERCFKRRHSGRYNQMKCLLQIHLPTSLWLTSQIGIKMRGSCGSLQQCINTILQRFGNMIRCFFITTYLMFFEQLLKIENFQTKQQCFQHPMRGKWNFKSYETLNLIPQQNIWRQQIFFEISLCFYIYILHIWYNIYSI